MTLGFRMAGETGKIGSWKRVSGARVKGLAGRERNAHGWSKTPT
jgi:hypothetical protein